MENDESQMNELNTSISILIKNPTTETKSIFIFRPQNIWNADNSIQISARKEGEIYPDFAAQKPFKIKSIVISGDCLCVEQNRKFFDLYFKNDKLKHDKTEMLFCILNPFQFQNSIVGFYPKEKITLHKDSYIQFKMPGKSEVTFFICKENL